MCFLSLSKERERKMQLHIHQSQPKICREDGGAQSESIGTALQGTLQPFYNPILRQMDIPQGDDA